MSKCKPSQLIDVSLYFLSCQIATDCLIIINMKILFVFKSCVNASFMDLIQWVKSLKIKIEHEHFVFHEIFSTSKNQRTESNMTILLVFKSCVNASFIDLIMHYFCTQWVKSLRIKIEYEHFAFHEIFISWKKHADH